MGSSAVTQAPTLRASGIVKVYPGVKALDEADLVLHGGEVHALMGENGAGKSTLVGIIAGAQRPDAGEIHLDGLPVSPSSPGHARGLGIRAVHQELTLLPHLSVAENLAIGGYPSRAGVIGWRAVRRRAREALAELGLSIDPRRPVGELPIAIRQLVAIAREMQGEARVLILDEPTSSLDRTETERLFEVVRAARDRGVAIVFITHFLDQVYEIADRVTVLRGGRVVGAGRTADLPRLRLISLMLGRDVAERESRLAGRNGESEPAEEASAPVVCARGLRRGRALRGASLEVRRGEVVGLAGLLGSGRTELARAMFGADRPDAGQLAVDGRRRRLTPRRSSRLGIGLCPEDRKSQGLCLGLSVAEGLTLAMRAKRGWWRPLRRGERQEIVGRLTRDLAIRAVDSRAAVGTLSGGNQQKVLLGAWIATNPRVLLLDEPTRGVDIGAKDEILRRVRSMCDHGLGVVFISAELEEIVRACDRVVVMRDRETVGELRSGEIDEHRIMRMIGAERRA
ncbi:MAG: sugar ABC transporter ATP-binding protein [Phycisphaeraceae bacterium]|nr:sugar ABC transporter ATP-binding protein [Phycisphaeraceae bacterium]